MGLPVILLVEDNRDDEELTIASLRDAKVQNEIHVVRDGEEALNYIFQRGDYSNAVLPQLVLLDLKLPKVNGLEVLKEIRSDPRTKELPVVIFTSSKEDRDLIEGYHLGANSYVQKPVDFEQFAHAVAHLGTYWLVMNQFPPHWDWQAS